jgi:general secretion pathway protein G
MLNETIMIKHRDRIDQRAPSARKPRGFTLVELLVVLAILGLLAGLVGPQVMKFLGSSKTKTASLQISDLGATLDLYRLEVGRYPSTSEGLEALVADPGNTPNWNGPYLKKTQVPKDPWGNDYQYRSPGQNGPYDVWSLGADGRDGGEGEDQDIKSWETS